jgi:two-component system response regulator FixJ
MPSFRASNCRQRELEPPAKGGHASAWIHLVETDIVSRVGFPRWMGARGFRTRFHPSHDALIAAGPWLEPGCVILDLVGPMSRAMEVLDRLRVAAPEHPVVVCGCGDVALAVAAMRLGAADVLGGPVGWAALADGVERVLEGGAYCSASLPGRAMAVAKVLTLSPRQRDVLRGVMAGKLSKTIAHELGISVRTVEGYRAAIMMRTGARCLSDLIRIGVAAGF